MKIKDLYMPKENGYFQYCLELVAKKAHNETVSEWTDGNFILLSESIFVETGYRIHRNTLKMLYGKSFSTDIKPEPELQNALAYYLGFENWKDFTKNAELESLTGPQYFQTGSAFPFLTTPIPMSSEIKSEELEKPSYRWLAVFFMLLIILFAFFYWRSIKKNSYSDHTSWKSKYLSNSVD